MTTIVAVRKGRTAALAADTLSKQGSCRLDARFKARPSKIFQAGDAFMASAGSLAKQRMLESVMRRHADMLRLGSIDEIYETFRCLHPVFIDEYHLLTSESHDSQPFESSQVNVIIVSPGGIFEVQSYREVQEYSRFWATGSGYEYALGALECIYDESSLASAVDLARRSVEVGCVFDDSSGAPVTTAEVILAGA